MKNDTDPCPCQKANMTYAKCCRPFHEGALCSDAKALMRSRYSAYFFKLEPYLLKTWHSKTRPKKLYLEKDAPMNWYALDILGFEEISQEEATVEFIARYRCSLGPGSLHEKSYFVKEEGLWYYVDGEIL
jgi:SEC-C motif-containing protein